MSDSRKAYEDQRFFFHEEQSPQINGVKETLTPQNRLRKTTDKVLSQQIREAAREKIVEILDTLLLDDSLTPKQITKIIEARKLMFKL